jgi:DNA ligase-associated metallophosphoesterase
MAVLWDRTGWQFLPERAIWWEAERTLIVSDLHLGKAAHFRRHGIAVPNAVNADTLNRLESLVAQWNPKSLLVLGDLFHSEENAEWGEFRAWMMRIRTEYDLQTIHLVEGNHDILPESAFQGLDIQRSTTWNREPFVFAHDPKHLVHLPAGAIGVAGHLHPAVSMKGKGKQSLKLPCWWFDAKRQILTVPTFGTFTGSVAVKPTKEDACWVTTGAAVLPVTID